MVNRNYSRRPIDASICTNSCTIFSNRRGDRETPVMLSTMAATPSQTSRSSAQALAPNSDRAIEPDLSFEHRTLQVLAQLRAAVQSLIAGLPVAPSRAVDLKRAMRIDAALAWQMFSLANHQDLLRIGRLVPKPGAMKRFMAAAQTGGASADLIDNAIAAYDDFERAVKDVAGDRRSFDAILSGLCPDDESALLRLRRAA